MSVPSELEVLCPVRGAWFDADALDHCLDTVPPRSDKKHVRVRLCDPDFCCAAGASWANALDGDGVYSAPARLVRRRSVAMQDDQCDSLADGSPVLGLRRGPVPLWVEATLLTVARFPHLPNGDCQARLAACL